MPLTKESRDIMLDGILEKSINAPLSRALEFYKNISDDFVGSIEATGVRFAEEYEGLADADRLRARLAKNGARVRNGGASVSVGPLSPACIACTGACVSRTFAITNNCHRNCFFCFNPNQKDFAYYCENDFPWREQLEDLAKETSSPKCIALSGGEPMLRPKETIDFFRYAKELFSNVHLRIYTSGDLLDEDGLRGLRDAGLDEIRFSIKQGDSEGLLSKVLAIVEHAVSIIPTVMVEMPVIPGSKEYMQDLLLRLSDIGIDGMNLLEFTYPLWNWTIFDQLGLTLKNPPFEVIYNYSYAGSIPVEGSELLCLDLMLWAQDKGLPMSLHYCSLENKHRAQMRNMNEPFAEANECYALDYEDFFLKTIQVYGRDRIPTKEALAERGCRSFIDDEESDCTSFHPKWLNDAALVVTPDGERVCPCVSWNIAVPGEESSLKFRELKVLKACDAPAIMLCDQTAELDKAEGHL